LIACAPTDESSLCPLFSTYLYIQVFNMDITGVYCNSNFCFLSTLMLIQSLFQLQSGQLCAVSRKRLWSRCHGLYMTMAFAWSVFG
jgi:hypothetical protein